MDFYERPHSFLTAPPRPLSVEQRETQDSLFLTPYSRQSLSWAGIRLNNPFSFYKSAYISLSLSFLNQASRPIFREMERPWRSGRFRGARSRRYQPDCGQDAQPDVRAQAPAEEWGSRCYLDVDQLVAQFE